MNIFLVFFFVNLLVKHPLDQVAVNLRQVLFTHESLDLVIYSADHHKFYERVLGVDTVNGLLIVHVTLV